MNHAATTRVAFCTEVLAEYKLHLHRRLARWPGYQVMVWHGPERPGSLPADVDPGDAFPHRPARNVHLRLGLRAVWQRLRRELWDFQPHAIVLEDGVRILSNWRILLEARARGVPVILYTHGENRQRGETRGRLLGDALEEVRQLLHRRAAALVFYTEEVAAAYRARHPKRACFAATNTLDTDAIEAQLAQLPADHRAATRAALGVPDGALLVATVGRLIPEHDPRPLGEAVRRARARGADCHLLVVGGGPLEDAWRRWLDALPPDERPAFHRLSRQSLAESTRLLAACDVFVQPGTIGLSIVHAFAVGLPFVVAEREGHGPEQSYLESGKNGLLLPDLGESLVEALLRLEREPDWRRSLAAGARRYARERLSPERQARGFIEAVDFALRRSAETRSP